MDKIIISIGGGEIRNKETLPIDEYIANLAKLHAGEKRAYGLFIPTASHDFMPYYNSFHKVYTGVFDIKTDVALTVFKTPDMDKIKEKFLKADFIYIGGGDTIFMLNSWKESGLLDLIKDAYDRGVILCGLSAGAIFYFEEMYTDSNKESGTPYSICPGLGWLKGTMTPHYNQRVVDFDLLVPSLNKEPIYGVEDNSALIFKNEELYGVISSGGNSYRITKDNLNKIKL